MNQLGLGQSLIATGLDTMPGGASDVAMWETGIGIMWETGINMLWE